MDKTIEKKMKKFILLLQTINESNLQFSIDNVLTENNNNQHYNDYCYYASICRIHAIQINGKIKEEFQELFNDGGFAIEQDKKGEKPFYIRTEKGLIRF